MRKEWHLISNRRPGMCDGVDVIKGDNCYTIYRYIDDWDEDGDTIYELEEYLKGIPEQEFKTAISATSDKDVFSWIKKHLIKEESNSLEGIVKFLDDNNIAYTKE